MTVAPLDGDVQVTVMKCRQSEGNASGWKGGEGGGQGEAFSYELREGVEE